MVHIREIYPELEKRNTRAVVILAESLRRMEKFMEKHQYPFPVLSDVRRTASKEYGVYVRVNVESVNIARPACFILDEGGIIRYVYVGSVQTDFPEDDELLSVLDELNA
jgi:peroxiredoxin